MEKLLRMGSTQKRLQPISSLREMGVFNKMQMKVLQKTSLPDLR